MTDRVETIQAEIAADQSWRADVRERYAAFVEADAQALCHVAAVLRAYSKNVPATLTAFIREIRTTGAYIQSGGSFSEDVAELRMRLRKELT